MITYWTKDADAFAIQEYRRGTSNARIAEMMRRKGFGVALQPGFSGESVARRLTRLGVVRLTPEERFLTRVKKGAPEECWPFLGPKNDGGYGRGPGGESAHRYMLRVILGQRVDEGTEVHHVCRNPACVNPAHLVVTPGAADHRRLHRLEDRIRILTIDELIADLVTQTRDPFAGRPKVGAAPLNNAVARRNLTV